MQVEIVDFSIDDWRGTGSTAYLQIYNEGQWTDVDGDEHLDGDYHEIPLTVNTGAHRIDEQSITLTSTTDAVVNANVRCRLVVVDANRKNPREVTVTSIPHTLGPTLTWGVFALRANAQLPWRDIETYTKTEIEYLLNQHISAVLTPTASFTVPGLALLAFFNVRDYGATGNGVTDDRAAIQAALDAVPATGGIVFFPQGDYLVSGSIQPDDNTTLMGCGYGSRIMCGSAGWFLVATVNMGIVNISNVNKVRVTGLRVYGTKDAPTDVTDSPGFPSNARTPKLIYMETVNGLKIDHCWFENSDYEGIWEGGAAANIDGVIIDANHFEDIGVASGLPAIQFNAEQSVISNNYLFNTGVAIGASGARLTIVGNFVKTVSSAGISTGDGFDNGVTTVTGNVVEFDCQPSGNARKGILLDGGGGSNHFTNVVGNTVRLIGNGTNMATCYYVGTAKDAQLVGNAAEIQVRGNGFVFLGSTAGTYVTASSNVVKVRGESGGSTCFSGLPNGVGQTLTARLSGNRAYGITRAQSSYGYDFGAATGTLNLTLAGDITEEGYVRIGSTFYDGTAEYLTDGLPLFERYDSTATSNVVRLRQPQIGMLNFQPVRDLSIAAGVLTISGHSSGYYKHRTKIRVDTEAVAATDDLDTISGGVAGDIIILQSAADGQNVVVKNNTGNIRCGADFTLETTRDRIMLEFNGTTWLCLSKQTN